MTAPQIRRTTAEQATQYVLGDLDAEAVAFVPAHTHLEQSSERDAANSLASHVTEEDAIGLLAGAYESSGLHGRAPDRHVARRQHGDVLTGLAPAQQQPSSTSYPDSPIPKASRMTKQPLSDVPYSEREGSITATGKEAKHSGAAVNNAWSGHQQPQQHHQQQQHQQQKQHSGGVRDTVLTAAPDSISIAVSAGPLPAQEVAQRQLRDLQARSALHSIREDHDIGASSARSSHTGTGLAPKLTLHKSFA